MIESNGFRFSLRRIATYFTISITFVAFFGFLFTSGFVSEAQSGPRITSVSPTQTGVGQVPKKITVTGSGFASGARVEFTSSTVQTQAAAALTGDSQLLVKGKKLPSAIFSQAGRVQIVVVNPNGQRSNSVDLTVGSGGGSGRIEFENTDFVVREGDTLQLRAVVKDQNGNPVPGAQVSFTSVSPEIASVDGGGLVRGAARGFASVTASASGAQSARADITVVRVENSADQPTGGSFILRDQAGRFYTSNTDRQIINRRDGFGAQDRLFAGRDRQRGSLDAALLSALFNDPLGMAADEKSGRIYVADITNSTVRALLPTGAVSTIAGAAGQTGSTDGALASARFRNPRAVEVDQSGNLYVADTENHTIRYVDLIRGTVSTVAGVAGQSGLQDGTGAGARFSRPTALKLSSDGRILNVTDTGNNVVRQVTRDGVVKTVGRNASVVNRSLPGYTPSAQVGGSFTFTNPQSVGVDDTGNVYVGDQGGVKVLIQRDGQFFDSVSLAPASALGTPVSFSVSGNDTVVLNTTGTGLSRVTVGTPEIASVTPDRAPIRTVVEIMINGRNFAPETRVLIDGRPASDLVFENSTRIRVKTPANEASGVQVLTLQHRGGIAQTRFTLVPPSFESLATGGITTFAGGTRFIGDGGDAFKAGINAPGGIELDGLGNLFVADPTNGRIRRIDAESGIITTIAGTGKFLPDSTFANNQPATATTLFQPPDVAVDPGGNVYCLNRLLHIVYKVDSVTGTASIYAGQPYVFGSQFGGDGGPATQAFLGFGVTAIEADRFGNLYIVDSFNSRIRRVNPQGIITTVVGNGQFGNSGDGGPATQATLNLAVTDFSIDGTNCATDTDGNLYFADYFNFTIRKYDPKTGLITRVAGNGQSNFGRDGVPALQNSFALPTGVAVAANGDLLITDFLGSRVWKVEAQTGLMKAFAGTGNRGTVADGVPATASNLNLPSAVAVDGAGNVYVSDLLANRVRKVDAQTGIIQTLVGADAQDLTGDGRSANEARLLFPTEVAVSPDNTLFIADADDGRVRATRGGSNPMRTVAGNGTRSIDQQGGVPALSAAIKPSGLHIPPNGDLLIADDGNNRLWRVGASGTLIAVGGNGAHDGQYSENSPALSVDLEPTDVVADGAGNLFLAEGNRGVIRRIDAATGLVNTVAGTGEPGYSGDGGQATSAQLDAPSGLVIDRDGNLLFADRNNHRIRKVDARTGVISTVAGTGQAVFTGDGGPATAAALAYPTSVAVDGNGNLFVADSFNLRIRKIMPSGIITSIIGKETLDLEGDGGPATAASILVAFGVAIDRAGNMLISDTGNNRVRIVKGIATPPPTPGIGPRGGSGGGGGIVTETEPNDSPSSAQALTGSLVAVNGNVAPNDAAGTFVRYSDGTTDRIEDLYRITVTQPSTVQLAVDWTQAGADLDLFLFGAGLGTDAASSILDASNEEDLKPEYIGPRLLQPGTYFIGVSLFDDPSNTATPYRLGVAVSPGGTVQTLSVDDGRLETGFIFGTNVFLNRLTPPSYPATVNQVIASFNNRAFQGQQSGAGSVIRVGVFADASGSGNPANATLVSINEFTVSNDGTTADFTPNVYNVNDVTITKGDFYVGYELVRPNGANVPPVVPFDTTAPRSRSFFSSNGGTSYSQIFTQDNRGGNLLIRAEVTLSSGARVVLGPESSSGGVPSVEVPKVALPGLVPEPKAKPKQLLGLGGVRRSAENPEELVLEVADSSLVVAVEAEKQAEVGKEWVPVEIVGRSFDPVRRLWTLTVRAADDIAAVRYVNQSGWTSNIRECPIKASQRTPGESGEAEKIQLRRNHD